jgi:hypothetical protein
MLRLTVSRPVCLGIKHPFGAYDLIFIIVWLLWVCWIGAPSLTRGWVCRLQSQLSLGSASHFRVRVPWDSWSHFTASDSRLPFSSPPTTRRTTVEVSLSLMLRLTVSRPVCLGIKHPSGACDQIFVSVRQLRVCSCGELSLTRGRVCRLQLLLVLARAVILGSETRGARDRILLSQIRDFPFRRFLRLAWSRWRYSIPPPHRNKVEVWVWVWVLCYDRLSAGLDSSYNFGSTEWRSPPPKVPILLFMNALLSNGLFQLVVRETCFNKTLSSNGLLRHNIKDKVYSYILHIPYQYAVPVADFMSFIRIVTWWRGLVSFAGYLTTLSRFTQPRMVG